jgi:prepilin-type N-terminal cleavage/methylation domain-containing protein
MNRVRPQFHATSGMCLANRRHGFTLPEVVIALTLTAIMGVCITMMITSVAAGTVGQQDGRHHLTRMQALQSRLLTQIHGCRAILAGDAGFMVYWVGDEQAGNSVNKYVNLSEMYFIQLNTTTNQLVLYTKTPGIADQVYGNRTVWVNAAKTALQSGWYTGTVLANNVTAFKATASNSVPSNAREVTISITIQDTYSTRTVCFAAGIRSQVSPI